MTKRPGTESEAKRLEALWSGDFGDAYINRNAAAGDLRAPFWKTLLSEFPVRRVLEVGCNLGTNLRWLVPAVDDVYGIDINQKAIDHVHREFPAANALVGPARELPFRDRWFDLVFTTGVLIHQPPETLPLVMNEIVRCSRRYVLCGEYFAEDLAEVPYRGHSGALYKRDFGGMYQQLFPELVLRSKSFLTKADGWDDITFWLFEKPL